MMDFTDEERNILVAALKEYANQFRQAGYREEAHEVRDLAYRIQEVQACAES